ncbi:MAG: hypothetical protein HRT99_00190 [Mycoplasmatales bacterium]|nr:hypothetical protein [Mycoplasmatales bacterium]
MKLLLDMVNKDFFMSIINNDKTIVFEHLENYLKKSDLIPSVFQKLISKAKIETKDIKSIYVVNGPGSFMGIRAGMVFGKTIALLTGAEFFSINNLVYISLGLDGTYYTDAKGKKSYRAIIKNKKFKIDIVDYENDSIIDYEEIINNPKKVLNLFSKIEDIVNFKSEYFKEPQIGAG